MPRPDLTAYLGQSVTVVVDRPLGSIHPRLPNLYYPLNYGYLPGTLSGDGKEIDAYVLGVDEPMQEVSGVVIAVLLRRDDTEDKLVIAPDGQRYSTERIREQVAFIEHAFDTRIVVAEFI